MGRPSRDYPKKLQPESIYKKHYNQSEDQLAGRNQIWIAIINHDLEKINPNLQLRTSELEQVTSHRKKKRNAIMRREIVMTTTGGKA